MLKTLLICIAAFTIGLIPLALVVLAIGVFGIPGYAIVGKRANLDLRSLTGYFIAFLGHLYLAVAVVALAVFGLRRLLAGDPHLVAWPLWIAAFIWCVAPPFAVATRLNLQDETEQFQAFVLCWVGVLAVIAFPVFVFFPRIAALGWGWLPWVP